jgi:OOP family OmpA-OmpF porin
MQPPVAVSAIQPGPGERVAIDQVLLLIDTSSSVEYGASRVARSFIAGMPEGSYDAGAINFGGYARETLDLVSFDRAGIDAYSVELSELREGTPIHRALTEAGRALAGRKGRAAVVLISDGLPTDEIGRPVAVDLSVQAARDLAAKHAGTACIHTVQIGADPAGTNFLKSLSQAAGCGTHRAESALGSAGAYESFERAVFLAAAQAPPKPMAAAPGDADGDTVLDDVDQCPGTLIGASVDRRGCWVLPGMNFATNSAEIEPDSKARLQREVVPVLERNPGVRIRIDGHTDDRGAAAYNQSLSERRANSVRSYLIEQGIDAGRLEAKGFGEEQPVAPNDTRENLRKNRRIELSILR